MIELVLVEDGSVTADEFLVRLECYVLAHAGEDYLLWLDTDPQGLGRWLLDRAAVEAAGCGGAE